MNNRQNVDFGLLLLRISIGGLMLLHGIHKIQAPAATIDFLSKALSDSGLPTFLSYGVFVGEILAPLLVLIGFRTKIFSPFIALTMLIAVYTRHANDIFSLTDNGGLMIELQALYLLGALALTFTGAGKFAVSTKNQWD